MQFKKELTKYLKMINEQIERWENFAAEGNQRFIEDYSERDEEQVYDFLGVCSGDQILH